MTSALRTRDRDLCRQERLLPAGGKPPSRLRAPVALTVQFAEAVARRRIAGSLMGTSLTLAVVLRGFATVMKRPLKPRKSGIKQARHDKGSRRFSLR